jgi:hypothetical protein
MRGHGPRRRQGGLSESSPPLEQFSSECHRILSQDPEVEGRRKVCALDWALPEAATEDKPGKVRLVKEYTLTPGVAHLYNEGDLHSPRRDVPTRLIRVEGRNVEQVQRLACEAA